jgi:hypothetical protein
MSNTLRDALLTDWKHWGYFVQIERPAAERVRDLYAKRERRSEQRRQRRERAQEAMVDLTNADPSVATPTTPADI